MILNNADNIMLGDTEVDAVYLGDAEIWSRSSAIELDCTRFDASDPKLYDKKGNELATLSMITGTIADNVYTTDGGLRATSAATSDIIVDFKKDEPWTLTFKFKALNTSMSNNVPSSLVNSNAFNIGVMYYQQWSNQSLIAFIKGMNAISRTFYNGGASSNGSGVADLLIPFTNFADFEQEVRFVNDGEYFSIYFDSVLKCRCASNLLNDISKVNLTTISSFATNNTNFIITGLKIEYFANKKPSYTAYRFNFTKFRGYGIETLYCYCFTRLCLYDANNNRLDTDSKCIAGDCIMFYGTPDVDYYYNRDTKMLVSNNSGQYKGLNVFNNHSLNVYLFVPANLPKLAKYSLITSPESEDYGTEFDPVSWTLETTADGGETWTQLDSKTDYDTPLTRSTETPKFDV